MPDADQHLRPSSLGVCGTRDFMVQVPMPAVGPFVVQLARLVGVPPGEPKSACLRFAPVLKRSGSKTCAQGRPQLERGIVANEPCGVGAADRVTGKWSTVQLPGAVPRFHGRLRPRQTRGAAKFR